MKQSEFTLGETIAAFIIIALIFLFVAHLDYLQTL